MGDLTREHPKCMTEIGVGETILSRQLKMIADAGIREVVITTGYYDEVLVKYCRGLGMPLAFTFVRNPIYDRTNYIYSIYCAREELEDDILLMHGDLVFEQEAFDRIVRAEESCMAVSSTLPLPEKDFKAVVRDGKVIRIGVEFFGGDEETQDGRPREADRAGKEKQESAEAAEEGKRNGALNGAMAAQALYHLKQEDWRKWLERIETFCESGRTGVYAENALNELDGAANIRAMDVGDLLCAEIDNPEDLAAVRGRLKEIENRTVYMCFSSDIIHGGHIAIIRKAQKLGRLMIGVLSDEAVASYKRMPLVPESERRNLFENIAGVWKVVEQKTLSYRENLEKYRPDIVVHGDDWATGFQKPIRDEVTEILAGYGGRLVEYPYSADPKYAEIDARTRSDLAMPDIRRGRLKRMLGAKGLITAMEAHDGLTGLIVENTVVHEHGGGHQFDAMWISSLCDSTAKGKPDIELVDMTSRFRTIEDITEVTTKPIIFDGDTGGKTEHFVYTVRSLERLGVSMVIIEDKTGLKKNSLFGTEVTQTQDSIEHFCEKIRAGKRAQRTKEFMICARIESLILEKGMEDALERAFAFTEAGADAIMIHSRKKDPGEVMAFIRRFREKDGVTPIVLVPTSFNGVREEEWKALGANIIIYANQLMRAEVPAMQKAAEMILRNHRAEECDEMLMPFGEIIRLIPVEE